MVGGNTKAVIEICTTRANAIGGRDKVWEKVCELNGFLDLSGGSAVYATYNAKIQESTHLFICDYVTLDERVSAENARMIIDGARYDITLIDNPMNLNRQLEIFLKFTGGQ